MDSAQPTENFEVTLPPELPEPTEYERERDAVTRIAEASDKIRSELSKVIIGQLEVIDELLIALLSGGHCLITGAPGLAKTLLVKSLAELFHLSFNRIQFTPDLMPADITGTEMIHDTEDGRKMVFQKGPIFANMILADEINRTPPKTQAALLEAMQEHHVTVSGRIMPLPEPFFVLATQNPIEQEGTYSLPEAQLDRFMFFIEVEYPTLDEERRIARETTGAATREITPQVSGAQIMKYQELVERVPVPDHIYDLAVDIVRATRPDSGDAPDFCQKLVSWGAGPRAVQYLIRGAKARAVLQGSYLVRQEDLEAVAHPVLRHRIITNFQAQAEGTSSTVIVDQLLDQFRDASA